MAKDFSVIELGVQALIDTAEQNRTAENADALVGLTFGGADAPLWQSLAEMTAQGRVGRSYDQSREQEAFSIDGGAPQIFDAVATYRAVVTYTDGTTASMSSVVIFQDTAGRTYLAPEQRQNSDQRVLEAKPIASLQLTDLRDASFSGLSANRNAVDFVRDEGEISGTLFVDSNGDKTQRAEGGRHPGMEAGLEGVVVIARDADGVEVARTTTDADGAYSFVLASGDYRIEVPTDVNTGPLVMPGQGDARHDSSADPATGLTGVIAVSPGSAQKDIDVGYAPDRRDGVVDGQAGGEVMTLGYRDADRDVITHGADVIVGDSTGMSVPREAFRWDGYSSRDVDGTLVQDTGTVTVTYSRTADTRGHDSSRDGSTRLNLEGFDPVGPAPDSRSSLTSRNTNEDARGAFAWAFSQEVSDVRFNVNDIDGDGVVAVRAYDAAGQEVSVTLIGGARLSVRDSDGNGIDDTADSRGGYAAASSGQYSLQVQVAGPVARIELEHTQDGRHDSRIHVTDILFDAGVPQAPGADLIDGAGGDDLIYGDTGPTVPERAVFSWEGLSSRDVDRTIVQESEGITVTYRRTADEGRHDSAQDGRTVLNTAGLAPGDVEIDSNGALESVTNGQTGRGGFEWAFSEDVSNVAFNVNDIDGDGVVRVLAFDAMGDAVVVDLAGGNGLTLSDSSGDGMADTATSQGGYAEASSETYNLQVRIAGPVARITLEHTQAGRDNSGIWVTDILFDAGVASVDQTTGAADMISGAEGDDTIFGQGGDDSVDGNAGSDALDLGGGDDLGIYMVAENAGARDVYDGGADHDTLRLGLTRAEWFRADVQADIAAYLAHLAAGDPAPFQFTAFDLSAQRFEKLEVLLDGDVIDPTDAPVTLEDDEARLDENGSAAGAVLDNDTVPDLIRSVDLVQDVTRGTLSFLPDGTYSYDPLGDFDFLAVGESTTESFTYRVTDADFDQAEATVTLIVSGSNDAVSVQAIDVAGALTEGAVLSDSGTLSFADPDASDRPQATAALSSLAAVAADATTPIALTSAQQSAFEAAFVVANPATNTNSGNINWTYAIAEPVLDFLAAGETVTARFAVTVDDAQGSTATETVTVTITGANDAPTISVGALDSDAKTLIETDAGLTAVGTLTYADPDLSDSVTTAVTGVTFGGNSGALVVPPTGDLQSMLSLDSATVLGQGAVSASAGWRFDSTPVTFDGLAVGDSLVLTYTLTATDSAGATATQTVEITINGSNDGPQIVDGQPGSTEGAVIEAVQDAEGAVVDPGTPEATGQLVAFDTDGTDLTWSGDQDSPLGAFTIDPVTGAWTYTLDNDAANALFASERAEESFTVTVIDADGATATDTVDITITGANDAPHVDANLSDLTGGVVETGVGAGVPDQDTASGQLFATDPDLGAQLAWSGDAQVPLGVFEIDGASGAWSFDLDQSGADAIAQGATETLRFAATVTDEAGATDVQDVTITVEGRNDAPTLGGGSLSAVEDGGAISLALAPLSGDVDSDDDASSLGFVVSARPDEGTANIVNGDLVFDPGTAFQDLAAGDTRQVSIGVQAVDRHGALSPEAFFVATVTGTNDRPIIAVAPSTAVVEATDAAAQVISQTGLVGFDDPDMGDLIDITAAIDGAPLWSGGTLTAAQIAVLSNGLTTGTTDAAAPLTIPWSYEARLDLDFLAAGETISIDYTVTARDALGLEADAGLSFQITGTNDGPVLHEDTNTGDPVIEQGALVAGNPDAAGNVLDNDRDPDANDTLTVTGVSPGTGQPDDTGVGTPLIGRYGMLTLGSGGDWTYRLDDTDPDTEALAAGQSVDEVFTYAASDGTATAMSLLRIRITGSEDNRPPTAAGSTLALDEDGSVQGQVATDDPDLPNDTLTHVVIDDVDNGTLVLGTDGRFDYSPDAHFSGIDSFTYQVSDDLGESATATVTFEIEAVADAPDLALAALPDGQEDTAFAIDLVAVLVDTDGSESLSVTLEGLPAGFVLGDGTRSVTSDGTTPIDLAGWTLGALIATPAADANGSFALTATAIATEASNSETATSVVTRTYTLKAVNDAPEAADDQATTAEDQAVIITVLTGDTDTEGGALTVTGVGSAGNGQVAVQPDFNVIYTPDANFFGTDSFTYTISDGGGATDTGTVTVEVTSVNDAPEPDDEAVTVQEDTALTIDVLDGDEDVDGDALSISGFEQGALGSVSRDDRGDGDPTNDRLTYTPDANAFGADSFTYVVDDGNGGSQTATVTVTITPVNDLPVFAGGAQTGAVIQNDLPPSLPSGLSPSLLDGTNGVAILGAAAGDLTGRWVAGLGDVDGDGQADVAVGGDFAGTPNTGAVYVISGASLPADGQIDLAALPAGVTMIAGIDTGDATGRAVQGAGDVNGDGIDDIIIGARFSDPNSSASGESATGEAYVVFGQTGGLPAAIDLEALDGTTGFRIPGLSSADEAGFAVDCAGDVNGDGFDDIIVGALDADPPGVARGGESYVIFGGNTGFAARIDLAALDGSNGFRVDGETGSQRSGVSTVGLGDVNGDGIDDFGVGTIRAGSSSSPAYIVFGTNAGFPATLSLSDIDGSNGYVVTSPGFPGRNMTSMGDINGDGVNDIGFSNQGSNSFALFGGAVRLAALDAADGLADGVIDRASIADGDGTIFARGGAAVAVVPKGAGDVNGDGIDDIIIGEGSADPNGQSNAGSIHVVYGGAGLGRDTDLGALAPDQGFRLDGVSAGDLVGNWVDGAGDVNGDGTGDMIVGSLFADPEGRTDAGAAYILFGGAVPGAAAGVLRDSGSFEFTDADPGDTHQLGSQFLSGTHGAELGSFGVSLDDSATGDGAGVLGWRFEVDNAAVRFLAEGEFVTQVYSVSVSDLNGAPDTREVTVTIAGVNDAPEAVVDDNAADAVVEAGATTPGDATATGDLLANDTDADLTDVLTVTGAAAGIGVPVAGTLGQPLTGTYGDVVITAGGIWTYMLNDADPETQALAPGQQAVDVFTYEVSDGKGGSATAELQVTIIGADDNLAPVADDDSATVDEDSVVTIDVLDGDSDPNGDPLTVADVTQSANGTVAIGPNNTVTYTPDADFNGVDSFTYTLSDGVLTDTATVMVTVTGTDDAPRGVNQTAEAPENTGLTPYPPLTGTLVAVDPDAGATQTWTAGTFVGAGGTLTVNCDGSYSYVPTVGFSGIDTFTATVTDDLGLTGTADLRIEVSNESFVSESGQEVTVDLNADATGDKPAGAVSLNLSSYQAPSVNVIFAMDASGSVGTSSFQAQTAAVSAALADIQQRFAGSGIDVDAHVFSFASRLNTVATGSFNNPDNHVSTFVVLGDPDDPNEPGGRDPGDPSTSRLVSYADVELVRDATQAELDATLSGIQTALASMVYTRGYTPWHSAFEQIEAYLDNEADAATALNQVLFITDGFPIPNDLDGSGTTWRNALASLQDSAANGYDVAIEAFGVGNQFASQTLLNVVDPTPTPVSGFGGLSAALTGAGLFPAQLVSLAVTLEADGVDEGIVADANSPGVVAGALEVDLALADVAGIEDLLGTQNEFAVTAVFDLDGDATTTTDQVTLSSYELIGFGAEAVITAGTSGNDLLMGSVLADDLGGDAGNDLLLAGEGEDTVTGGTGDDRLGGGAGADQFVFSSGDGLDTLLDFNAAEDLIVFSGFGVGLDAAGLVISEAVPGTVVVDYATGTLTLEDTTLAEVTSDVFVFV